jgi:hypothetical protein
MLAVDSRVIPRNGRLLAPRYLCWHAPAMPYKPDEAGRSTALPLLRFRCRDCSYGASSRREPVRCPMCGGVAWEAEGWHPFADLETDLFPLAADTNAPLAREAVERAHAPRAPRS